MKKIIRNPYFLLFLILCAALLLRVINLKDNVLFAYDQARDAQRIFNMVYKGDIKIVGPETDIQGIFNGPLLYYVLAPIYFFSHFNPNAAALFFVLVNVGTILLVYWATKILFKKDGVALLASLLWAFSYEQGFFARYISNASPMSTTTTIFFIGLALFFLRKKQYGLPLSAIGLALAIHCNFYFIYLFLFYPLCFAFFKQRPTIKTLLWTTTALVMLLSPWIITELKWKFVGTRSLLAYFLNQGVTAATSGNPLSFLWGMCLRYYERISQGIYFSFIPNKPVGFLLIFGSLVYLVTKKRSAPIVFLSLWVLNTFPLFAFKSGVHSVEAINGSIFVPLTILVSLGIFELQRIKIYNISFVSILCISGIVIYGFISYSNNNFIPNSIHTGVPSLLKNAKRSIDYTYEKAQKKDFGICAVSEPLFMNTVWGFLYSTYGKQKYGYLPYWTGQQQTLNESFIPYAKKKYGIKFIIQEPLFGIPSYAPRDTYYIEDTYNYLIDQKWFGAYSVQMRTVLPTLPNTNMKKYTPQQRKSIEEDISKVPQFSCDNIYE
jgi:4-amino-4-deoxy-L-arabinose transferase-like glycosyltransferase